MTDDPRRIGAVPVRARTVEPRARGRPARIVAYESSLREIIGVPVFYAQLTALPFAAVAPALFGGGGISLAVAACRRGGGNVNAGRYESAEGFARQSCAISDILRGRFRGVCMEAS